MTSVSGNRPFVLEVDRAVVWKLLGREVQGGSLGLMVDGRRIELAPPREKAVFTRDCRLVDQPIEVRFPVREGMEQDGRSVHIEYGIRTMTPCPAGAMSLTTLP